MKKILGFFIVSIFFCGQIVAFNLDWPFRNYGSPFNTNISGEVANEILRFDGTNWVNTNGIIVKSTGEVGIGTTTPAYDLDVVGTINATEEYLLNGSDINTGGVLSNIAYLDQENNFAVTLNLVNGVLSTVSNQDLFLVPDGSGYTRVGDSSISTHNLNTKNDFFVSNRLEVDGIFYADSSSFFDGTINSETIIMGNNTDLAVAASAIGSFRLGHTTQTLRTVAFLTGSENNHFIMSEWSDRNFDFAHSLQTNPTFYIHSANQAPDEYIGFTHDQTDGVISVGTGDVKLDDSVSITGTLAVDTDILYVDSVTDRVGIGTPTPTAKLDVSTPGENGVLAIENSSAVTVIYLGANDKSYFMDSVGIGLTNPSFDLDVTGTTNISADLIVDTNTFYVDSSNDKVGVGTTLPSEELYVVGDITYTNNAYGELTVSYNTTATVLIQNVYQTVTVNVLEGEVTKNVTYTVGGGETYLTVSVDGVYGIQGSLSFSGGVNDVYHGGVSINDAEPEGDMEFNRKLNANGDQGCVCFGGLIRLSATDTIRVKLENTTSSTGAVVTHMNLRVYKIDV